MKVGIDRATYKLLLAYKRSCFDTGKRGETADLEFLYEDTWLRDTVVINWVARLNGTWRIYLVFVHHKRPFLFIKRFIKTQISEPKAVMEAEYMKRLAAKDQRGTLKLEERAFDVCSN
jgi:hypothetical protein